MGKTWYLANEDVVVDLLHRRLGGLKGLLEVGLHVGPDSLLNDL